MREGMWYKIVDPVNAPNYPDGSEAYPNGARVPWLASQTDLLADDWQLT